MPRTEPAHPKPTRPAVLALPREDIDLEPTIVLDVDELEAPPLVAPREDHPPVPVEMVGMYFHG